MKNLIGPHQNIFEGQNRSEFPPHLHRIQTYYLISKRIKLLPEHADG
jgi:hypothetical protein